MTKKEFTTCPIGQKFIERCCSGTYFLRAVKVSDTLIDIMSVNAHDYSALCRVKEFNPEFDWLEPVVDFHSPNGEVETFEDLKKIFGC